MDALKQESSRCACTAKRVESVEPLDKFVEAVMVFGTRWPFLPISGHDLIRTLLEQETHRSMLEACLVFLEFLNSQCEKHQDLLSKENQSIDPLRHQLK